MGGGPAGLVLGLLLARAGVATTVLEKHGDFLRDFRGDTVHTSTLTLLDELGLWERFAALPQRPLRRAALELDAGTATVADFGRLRAPHPQISMVPQWHLLDMLATAAAQEPSFSLRVRAEVTGLVHDGERVTGVRWVEHPDPAAGGAGAAPAGTATGQEQVLDADLVVACDGRRSVVRAAAGLPLRRWDVPMDVWWLRVPRRPGDPEGGLGRVSAGRILVMLDRGDYFQCALLVPQGADAALRAQPVQVVRDALVALHPWLADRVEAVRSWEDVPVLQVALDRLRRWHRPGLLLIGDAAHAMSPIGGVGINLAVQDAVAAARLLAPVLASAPVDGAALDRACARLQRRRALPTRLTQAAQRLAHRAVVAPLLRGRGVGTGRGAARMPLPVRLLDRIPALQALPARAIGLGVLPEHAPPWARRPPGR